MYVPLARCVVSHSASWNLGFFICKMETDSLTTHVLEQIRENQMERTSKVSGIEKES